jgi:hypothetical protein
LSNARFTDWTSGRHLVVRNGRGDALLQAAGADALGGVGHGMQRLQHAAGNDPRNQKDQGKNHRIHREQDDDFADLLLDLLGVLPGIYLRQFVDGEGQINCSATSDTIINSIHSTYRLRRLTFTPWAPG